MEPDRPTNITGPGVAPPSQAPQPVPPAQTVLPASPSQRPAPAAAPLETPIPKEETLEDAAPASGATLDELEKAKRRITHVENDFDAFGIIRDVRFERIMFAVGIGLVVSLSIIFYIFYNTVETREYRLSLAAQVEADFYAKLLKDKDYVFSYQLAELKQYDPLTSITTDLSEADGLGKLSSSTDGGYRVSNGVNAQVFNQSGKLVLELGDDAIHIDTLLLAPDGNSFIFDVKPANRQAEEKFGLRLGAYEFKLDGDDFETLVSDASSGIDEPEYINHFVQILSFSPNGRYLAYTNQGKLWLFDRLSNASVEIAALDRADQQPDTGWAERIEPEIEQSEPAADTASPETN